MLFLVLREEEHQVGEGSIVLCLTLPIIPIGHSHTELLVTAVRNLLVHGALLLRIELLCLRSVGVPKVSHYLKKGEANEVFSIEIYLTPCSLFISKPEGLPSQQPEECNSATILGEPCSQI